MKCTNLSRAFLEFWVYIKAGMLKCKWGKCTISTLNKFFLCWIYGGHGEFDLWPYANYTLLWTSMAEKLNSRKRFVEVIRIEFEHICETVDKIRGKAHLWPHISQSWLRINNTKVQNCATSFSESFLNQILRKPV
jgi:hypothetical protein